MLINNVNQDVNQVNNQYLVMINIKLIISRTNVASVSSVFNDTRKVEVLSLPETIKEKSTFRAKALRRELVASGGSGKTTRVFIRVNTKTSRDKIKANQMDFIKTKCKQRNVNLLHNIIQGNETQDKIG